MWYVTWGPQSRAPVKCERCAGEVCGASQLFTNIKGIGQKIIKIRSVLRLYINKA